MQPSALGLSDSEDEGSEEEPREEEEAVVEVLSSTEAEEEDELDEEGEGGAEGAEEEEAKEDDETVEYASEKEEEDTSGGWEFLYGNPLTFEGVCKHKKSSHWDLRTFPLVPGPRGMARVSLPHGGFAKTTMPNTIFAAPTNAKTKAKGKKVCKRPAAHLQEEEEDEEQQVCKRPAAGLQEQEAQEDDEQEEEEDQIMMMMMMMMMTKTMRMMMRQAPIGAIWTRTPSQNWREAGRPGGRRRRGDASLRRSRGRKRRSRGSQRSRRGSKRRRSQSARRGLLQAWWPRSKPREVGQGGCRRKRSTMFWTVGMSSCWRLRTPPSRRRSQDKEEQDQQAKQEEEQEDQAEQEEEQDEEDEEGGGGGGAQSDRGPSSGHDSRARRRQRNGGERPDTIDHKAEHGGEEQAKKLGVSHGVCPSRPSEGVHRGDHRPATPGLLQPGALPQRGGGFVTPQGGLGPEGLVPESEAGPDGPRLSQGLRGGRPEQAILFLLPGYQKRLAQQS